MSRALMEAAAWARMDVMGCGLNPMRGKGLELAAALVALYYGLLVEDSDRVVDEG